jgi:hypothetical protein
MLIVFLILEIWDEDEEEIKIPFARFGFVVMLLP